jgi:hypothetical protein
LKSNRCHFEKAATTNPQTDPQPIPQPGHHMKTKILLITFISSFFILHSAFGQGALTPPGAPAPTMKTLAQIEARTPISSAPFTISAPGSYYLTTNLTISSGNAINVNANNVTLDLNGFTLFSTENPAASSAGIMLNSVGNITIVRGFISGGVTNSAGLYGGTYGGSGFGNGITYSGEPPFNVRISGVSVSGCQFSGIILGTTYNGYSSVVESCTVKTVGSYGILADSISDSTAWYCGGTAIFAYSSANNCSGVVSASGLNAYCANNCLGTTFGSGIGLNAYTANNCFGESASGTGISTTVATGCYGYSQSGGGTGVNTFTATGCYGESYLGSGDGVLAYISNNCTGISDGSGYGILSYELATGCYGTSGSGVGLNSFIATGCHASSFAVAHNVNSF